MAVASELFDSYFTEHPHVLEAYIASAVAFPLGTVVAPALVGGLVERVKAGATLDDVKLRVLILIGIVAVGFLVNMLQQYANVEVGTSFRVHVRKEIIERVILSRAYNYHSVDIPETIYKLIELPDSLAYMLNLFKDIGPAMATIVAMFVYFTWLSAQTKNPCIAGTILLYVLFMWGSVAYNAHVSIPRLVANTGESINLYNRSGDVLEVLPHTLAIAATSEEATRHSDMMVQHMAHMQETHNHMVEIQMVTAMLMMVTLGSVFGMLWQAQRANRIDGGTFTASIFVLMCSRAIMHSLVTSINPFLKEYAYVQILNQYFDSLTTEANASHALQRDAIPTNLSCPVPTLEFRNVGFAYSPDTPAVLSGVSFKLEANTRTLIQGGVGSGKSTIGLLAMGLQRATSGDVLICGTNVNELSRKGISHLVSLVPAVPALLNRTVRENMLYGLSDRNFTDADLTHALAVVGSSTSLDRSVGHRGEELSTGQRKLVYLAKAYLQNTPILIVDELTANLDAETANKVVDSLNIIAAGKVLIFVSHDPPTQFHFDTTLHVFNGTVEQ